MNMQNDEAFLSLLSSQRQLLSQLNRENQIMRNASENLYRPPVHHQQGLNAFCTNVAPIEPSNRHPIQRRSSLDMLLSRRMSMGYMPEQVVLPALPAAGYSAEVPGNSQSTNEKKRDAKLAGNEMEDNFRWKRQRPMTNEGLEFLSSNLLDAMKGMKTGDRAVDEEEDDDAVEPIPIADHCVRQMHPLMTIDPVLLKKAWENFTSAMARSQKSQQDIHDWDRKMGLKRSHSKTMRLSSRSRKKLAAILTDEINKFVGNNNR